MTTGEPITIAVANLKGGTAKTTTTAFIAHALFESGLRVLVVDADPQGSCLRWSESGDWPMPVIGLATRTLHKQLPGVGGHHDVVVIDTPPLEEQRGIVVSALRVASHVLIPVAPTPIEIERLAAVRETLDDVAPLRIDGRPPLAAVVLTRTVPSAASTTAWRDVLVEIGWNVVKAEVRRLELYAQAHASPIRRASETAYGYVVTELLDLS